MLKRLLAVLLMLSTAALAACSDDDDTAKDPASAPAGDVTCTYTDDGRGASRVVDPPPATPTVGGIVSVTMDTTLGEFRLTLDAGLTPCTVNSFVSLAEQGYFDNTTCHRLTTTKESGIAVLQCGDPTGTGIGGPGYTFADELAGSESYPPGTLAMANGGPDTNGSQFFIVYGDSQLAPDFTVFGNVDDGTVKAITKLSKKGTVPGEGGMTAPAVPVDIESVTVS